MRRLIPIGEVCQDWRDNVYYGLVNRQGDPIEPNAITLSGPGTAVVSLPQDGVTDVVSVMQAAHDRLLAQGGGPLRVLPRILGRPKFQWKSTFFHDPRVSIEWPGKGLCDFVLAAHFPLASFIYRDTGSGVVSYHPILQRCAIYLIPYAPFSPKGTILTPSSEGVPAYYEGFTIDGNASNQDAEVFGIYAPPGKTDPNWAFVAGAYSQDQTVSPGGAINMSADAQAYYGYTTRGVEIFNTSGTQFFSGSDRQRTHLMEGTKGTLGGVNNPDGSALYTARGYDIQGNDGWVFGGGWGNNNGASQGSGESGMLRVQCNYFPPKGTDAGSISLRDEAVNGSMNVANVINTLARYEVSSGNPIKARGGGYVGNNFLWGGSMQTTGPNAGRPIGATSEDADAFLQVSGYGQTVDIGNVRSVGTDGTVPKYHLSAMQGAGVRYSGIATSNPDGSQSYRGATPFYTDGTLGAIGFDYFDPYAAVLHIGVHWKGLLAGPTIANTQFVQFDSPINPVAGIVGQSGGTAPPAGFQGEPGAANATITLVNNTAADVTTLQLKAPGEYDLYGEVQIAATTATAAAAGAYFEISISTAANTLDSSSARLYAGQILPIPAGATNVPMLALRVGPIRVGLSVNTTYHLVVKGNSLSTNAAISAAGVLHSRRW